MSDAFQWLLDHWYATVGGIGGLGAVVAAIVRRYRKSVAREFEPFTGYIYGTLKFAIGRFFSGVLARQFGIRRYVAAKLRAFPTHLLVPSVDQARLEIDTAYVRLSLSSTTSERVSDASLLTSDAGSILIFGEPGSGKSSLTKKLFRQACKTAYRLPDRGQLPIHIELRQLQWAKAAADDQSPGPWLLGEILQKAANVPGVHDPEFIVNAFIRKAGVIVFLDGLDEVPSGSVRYACDAIRELAESLRQHSPKTTVITTSRTQLRGVLPRPFIDSMGAIYHIEPFTPADIFSFLRRWPYQGNALGETQRIFSNLQKHQTMSEMCTNPLVLSMYVAQDQRYVRSDNLQSVRFPDTRPEFYSSVIGELLLYRRSEQLGQTMGGSHLRKQREMLLGRIALDHLLKSDDPANSISWDLALRATRECVGLPSDLEAEQYLVQLSIDTGMFAEERPGESLRFMHLTLCEYLAAKEATEAEANELDELLMAVSSGDETEKARRLWETVVFAVALLPRGERQRALEKLNSFGAAAELIMRSIREAQAYDLPLFDEYLGRLTDELRSTPIAQWDTAWLSHVRLTISCLTELASLEHLSNRAPAPHALHLLRDLTSDSADRLEKLFDLYLEHSPAEALTLADSLGLQGRFRSPRRLVDAMQQPDFVVFGMNQVSAPKSDQELTLWAEVLAEAGLKYALVARMLLDENPINTEVDTERDWARNGVAANSLYGSVLAVATAAVRSLTNGIAMGLPRLGVISMLTPTHIPANPLDPALRRMAARFSVAFMGLSIWGFELLIANRGVAPIWAYFIIAASTLLAVSALRAYKWGLGIPLITPVPRLRKVETMQRRILNAGPPLTAPVLDTAPVLTNIGGKATLVLLPRNRSRVMDTYTLPPLPIRWPETTDDVFDMRSVNDYGQADFLLTNADTYEIAFNLNLPTRTKSWFEEIRQFLLALPPDWIVRRLRRGSHSPIVVDLNTGQIVGR